MKTPSTQFKRTLQLDLEGHNAAFLWGPRKTGKTTLLKKQFKNAKFYDLLDTELKNRLMVRPSLLREEILAKQYRQVVVDEIQKVPELLDEIHWCLENTKTQFVLCGSSARKVKRGAANLLGGRAWRFELFPLTTQEIGNPDLARMINHGLIPSHYLTKNPDRSLRSYVADYLEQEVHSEALTRNVPAFARFLEAAAVTHGQLVNYTNIAHDCGVASKTVKEYYAILEDTLLGHHLLAWQKKKKRRLIQTPKFYFFDPGVARTLSGIRWIEEKTQEFGNAFEHLLIEEIRAYLAYTEKPRPLAYWRTSTGYEVDLIVGALDLAIEFKAVKQVAGKHLRGLRALQAEHSIKEAMVVSLDPTQRQLEGKIMVYPWRNFCKKLWSNGFDI